MERYCRFIVRHPYVIQLITIACVVSMTTVAFIYYPVSYLINCISDPTKGFETRGTVISGRSLVMRNILVSIDTGQLDYLPYLPSNSTRSTKLNAYERYRLNSELHAQTYSSNNLFGTSHQSPEVTLTERGNKEMKDEWVNIPEVNMSYPVDLSCNRFIMRSTDDRQANLFTPIMLRSMCGLEDQLIRSYFGYNNGGHSLAFYVAGLANKTCAEIDQSDVDEVGQLLIDCSPYYESKSLKVQCTPQTCVDTPPKCYQYDAIYKIFHYLTDRDFRSSLKDGRSPFLKYAHLVLIDRYSSEINGEFFFLHVDDKELRYEQVIVDGVNLDYKYELFEKYMKEDLIYFLFAGLLIILVLFIYLRSVILIIVTVLNVIFSFLVGYFIYHVIFRFNFFPFVNICSILILIALGADDIFVFSDAFEFAKCEQLLLLNKSKRTTKLEIDIPSAKTTENETQLETNSITNLPEEKLDPLPLDDCSLNKSILSTRNAISNYERRSSLNSPSPVDRDTIGDLYGCCVERDIEIKMSINFTIDQIQNENDVKQQWCNGSDHTAPDMTPMQDTECSEGELTNYVIQPDVGPDQFTSVDDDETLGESVTIDENFLYIVLSTTFRHAASSILVTSLTTALAMFMNFASRIIVVRCFGVFCMTAILVNFLLIITFVPAVVVSTEQITEWLRKCRQRTKRNRRSEENIVSKCYSNMRKLTTKLHAVSIFIFRDCLTFIATRAWFVCILVFLIIGIGGFVLAFIQPRMSLPSSLFFPLFRPDHPFERYDTLVPNFEFFESASSGEESSAYNLPFYFVWGISDSDNSDKLNPFDNGTLDFTPFDPYSRDTQVWMVNFCNALKNSSYIEDSDAHVECSYNQYWTVLERPCNSVLPPDMSQCCEQSVPADAEILQKCMPFLVAYNFATSTATLGGPMFDPLNSVKSFIYQINTKIVFSQQVDVMEDLFNNVGRFFSEQLASAPSGLQNGWFYSYFEFYDLQKELARGTYVSMALSVGVCAVVLLLTTLDLLISLYALLTIVFCISVTVGSLILLGWELNVVESSVLTMAVGLSVDFTIHYGVAYVHAKSGTSRTERVRGAFERVGSALTMAAGTTFLAGVAVMPSQLIAFRQIGTFLMLVMVISWTFATFFFQSLCSVIGPTDSLLNVIRKYCAIPHCSLFKRKSNADESAIVSQQPNDIHNGITQTTSDSDDIHCVGSMEVPSRTLPSSITDSHPHSNDSIIRLSNP